MIADKVAAVIDRAGQTVTLRKVTSDYDVATGVNAVNPPSTPTLKVNGTTASGLTTIALDATTVTGRLIVGDSFLISGDATVYTLTNNVNAASNGFAGVTFTPALALEAADDADVTVTFSADHSVKASVRSFGPKEIIGLIQQGDREVRMASLTVTPARGDKITIGAEDWNIENVDTRNFAGDDVLHIIQVRG